MKILISVVFGLILSAPALAAPKVKIESVRVVVTEKGKEPVKVLMPYWVAKGGAEVTSQLDLGEDKIPMKEIIQVIEKAPRLGTVMTIEEGGRKIVVSIE